MQRRRAIRLVDIAEACGVSKAAAARALSRAPERSELSRETYERIRRAAARMGYRGPGTARAAGAGLVAAAYGSTAPKLFGVGGHLAAILAGELALHGRDLALLSARGDDGWIDRALARQVEGIALLWPEPPGAAEAAARTGLPVIALECAFDLAMPRVLHDDPANGALMASHLLALGHRRLAFVLPSTLPTPHPCHARRLAGWRAALAEAGVRGRELVLGDAADATALGALLRSADAPTAIGCSSDHLAQVVIPLATSLGIAVPDRLSVIGCDASLGGTWPPLTSIYLHPEEVAKRGVRLLRSLAAGEAAPPGPLLVPGDLVPRASTAPAPRGRRPAPTRRRR